MEISNYKFVALYKYSAGWLLNDAKRWLEREKPMIRRRRVWNRRACRESAVRSLMLCYSGQKTNSRWPLRGQESPLSLTLDVNFGLGTFSSVNDKENCFPIKCQTWYLRLYCCSTAELAIEMNQMMAAAAMTLPLSSYPTPGFLPDSDPKSSPPLPPLDSFRRTIANSAP